jgi:GTPase SAR1 family protein
MSSNQATSYPYGYRPIQTTSASIGSTLPEKERLRAQTRRQQQRNMRSYKVLLIGESGVGKSTLVARLCEDRFLAESRQHTLGELAEIATHSLLNNVYIIVGIDMFEKEVEIDGEPIKMYIW